MMVTFFISTCNTVCYGQHVHVHTNSWVQILQRFTNSHNNVKNNVESIQDGQARSGRETKDERRKVGGRRSREGINNISAQLIPFPLSFFHASIGIPVGHLTASLAGHFPCNQNGTLSLCPYTAALKKYNHVAKNSHIPFTGNVFSCFYNNNNKNNNTTLRDCHYYK